MNRNITIFASVILAFALFFTYAVSGSTAVLKINLQQILLHLQIIHHQHLKIKRQQQ